MAVYLYCRQGNSVCHFDISGILDVFCGGNALLIEKGNNHAQSVCDKPTFQGLCAAVLLDVFLDEPDE